MAGSPGGGSENEELPILETDRLTVTPSNSIIFIDETTSTPANQTFVATFGAEDVSAAVTFSATPDTIGQFVGPEFTSIATLGGPIAVTIDVQGTYQGETALARLTVVEIRRTPDEDNRKDFFFSIPYDAAPEPESDTLTFSTDIKKADVVLLVDTTASMEGAINNLKGALTNEIIPALGERIASVGISIVNFRDSFEALVVRVEQEVTEDPLLAAAAVNNLQPEGGGDQPEAQAAALHYALTGLANPADGIELPEVLPSMDRVGAVQLRPGAVPVLLLITDADWHNPSGSVTFQDVVAAFEQLSAKFIGVYVGEVAKAWADHAALTLGSTLPPEAFEGQCGAGMCCTGYEGAAVAPYTGDPCPDIASDADASFAPSVLMCRNGAPQRCATLAEEYCRNACGRCLDPGPARDNCLLTFDGGVLGDGVSSSIVKAVEVISVGAAYDVTTKISNDPANVANDGTPVDATQFITSIRAMSEGDPALGCPAHETYDADGDGVDDTFRRLTVGTPVCFEVRAAINTTVPPDKVAQLFNAFVDVIGMPGDVDLGDRRQVVFLVPPEEPDGTIH